MNRRGFLKKVKTGSVALASLPVLDALATPASAQQEGSLIRWDIIHLDFTTTPFTVSAGGVASASVNPDFDLAIKLTGSGSFVAPVSGGTSNHANGGGTWETFGPGGVSTGSGTYEVRKLLSWQFANFQTPGAIIDQIDVGGSNGNALLAIVYSDGNEGILAVGCHGPGSPDGIQEGVIATKGFVTYWSRKPPVAGVDQDRTSFHTS